MSESNLDRALAEGFGVSSEHSVLRVIERITGEAPRILLREIASDQGASPLIDPGSSEKRSIPQGRGSYQILGEIARGGMGVVMKGHDNDLGRDVALKVLHKELAGRPEVLQRFVEEAQIGGQLQHPGIVPVYELGLMADERPYFTMKLVKGRTLAALLAERKSPTVDRRRLLDVFESVCQTMAYAHSRGVIHRDLKPANVMVGAFGEVQVVDWGLAKVLQHGGTADEKRQKQTNISIIETVRSEPGSHGSHSLSGSVMGTPAYMSPEQARGEIDKLDERSDVFSMGAVLCEILTGLPPYTGEADKTLIEAANARLDDATKRLEGCNADAELVALCRECLAPAQSARPRSAEVIALRIHEHLVSVEERARAAQIDAAEARVKAREERRARKLTVGLAASVLVTLVLAGGGWAWMSNEHSRRERSTEAQVNAALNESTLRRGEGDWAAALAAVERAQGLADSGAASTGLRARVISDRAAIESNAKLARAKDELAHDNAALIAELTDIRQPEGDTIYPTDWVKLDAVHGAIFTKHGLPLDAQTEIEAADALTARGLPVGLAAALDEWASVRSKAGDATGATRISMLARRIDGDTMRNKLRDALLASDVDTLKTIAESEELLQLPAMTLHLLAMALGKNGAMDLRISVLRRAQQVHPDDFMLAMSLARALRWSPSTIEEATRYYTAALALRPLSVEATHELGTALERTAGNFARALELFRAAALLHPDDGHLRAHLAGCLGQSGSLEAAVSTAREATHLSPRDAWAQYILGSTLEQQHELDGAIEAFSAAIAIDPKLADAHRLLGYALLEKGQLGDALVAVNEAIELDPKSAEAYRNRARIVGALGNPDGELADYKRAFAIDPESASACADLGGALAMKGELDAALEVLKKALKLDPRMAVAHYNVGVCLSLKGDLDGALAAIKRAIEIEPVNETMLATLGVVLSKMKHDDMAIDAYRQAIALDPTKTTLHLDLGNLLVMKGDIEEAVEECRKAVKLEPRNAVALRALGRALEMAGEPDGAITNLKESLEIEPGSAFAHEEMGKALRSKGDLAGAIRSVRHAIHLDPKRVSAYCELGVALQHHNEPDAAIEALRKAIELDSKCAVAYLNLGAVLNDGKADHVRAIQAFRKALELDPNLPNAQLNLGIALEANNDLEDATKAYRAAAERDPRSAQALSNLYSILSDAGDLEGALSAYGKLVALDPRSAEARYYLGQAFAKLGNRAAAIESYRHAIGIDPRYVNALEDLGVALAANGEYDAAITNYRAALAIDQRSLTAVNGLAWLLATCADHSLRNGIESVKLAKREVDLAPEASNSFNDLGAALCCAGEWAKAIKELNHSNELVRGEDEYGQYQKAINSCFLATAHAHLGQLESARSNFELAKTWHEAHPKHVNAAETARFLDEARAAIATGASR